MIYRSTYHEDIAILNVYTANNKAENLLIEITRTIDRLNITIRYFNTVLSFTDNTSRKEIYEFIEVNSFWYFKLDIYSSFYSTQQNIISFFTIYGIGFMIDNILSYKTNLKIFKRTEIIPSMLSDHQAISYLHDNLVIKL